MARNGVARRGHQRRCVSALGDRIKRSEGLGKNRQSGVPRSVPLNTPVVAGFERTNHFLRLVCAYLDRGRYSATKYKHKTPLKGQEIELISVWIFPLQAEFFVDNYFVFCYDKNIMR